MKLIGRLREHAKQLKREIHALYLAARDPRVPWYAKAFLAFVVGYALSPIDLIPDPIPILGYVDDLILLPLGIYLAVKMIPPDILAECRHQARLASAQPRRKNWIAGAIILIFWLAAIIAVVVYLWGIMTESFNLRILIPFTGTMGRPRNRHPKTMNKIASPIPVIRAKTKREVSTSVLLRTKFDGNPRKNIVNMPTICRGEPGTALKWEVLLCFPARGNRTETQGQ